MSLQRSLKKVIVILKILYEDGKVIIMTYISFKDNTVFQVYIKNQTSDKYEEDSNIDAEKFEKDNKPVYEENNMKK